MGVVPKYDETFVEGDLEKDDFIVYYALNDYVYIHKIGVRGFCQLESLERNLDFQ